MVRILGLCNLERINMKGNDTKLRKMLFALVIYKILFLITFFSKNGKNNWQLSILCLGMSIIFGLIYFFHPHDNKARVGCIFHYLASLISFFLHYLG